MLDAVADVISDLNHREFLRELSGLPTGEKKRIWNLCQTMGYSVSEAYLIVHDGLDKIND